MPEFDKEEYVFPDEKDVSASTDGDDNWEIEVEDDTPAEDQNREPMPKAIVDELEQDDLSKYDSATKEKLKQMRKVWHDERRAKETAYREQQEAVALSQRLIEENKRIKNILSTGEKEYVESMQTSATYELELAKQSYRTAYDNGDTDKLIAAQEAMQNASIKLAQVRNFKLPPLQEDDNRVQSQQEQYQPQAVPVPDAKSQKWRDNNDWFGTDEEMTATAYGVHAKLERQGVVIGSDEYYSTLDKTMRKRYAEYFNDEPDEPKANANTTQPKLSNVVAPASRSTSSKKIVLKQSQVALAKKLGLTNEQYAIAMKKLEK